MRGSKPRKGRINQIKRRQKEEKVVQHIPVPFQFYLSAIVDAEISCLFPTPGRVNGFCLHVHSWGTAKLIHLEVVVERVDGRKEFVPLEYKKGATDINIDYEIGIGDTVIISVVNISHGNIKQENQIVPTGINIAFVQMIEVI